MASSSNQYEGAGTKTVNMFSKLVSHGSNFVMEGVKNLVIKRHVRVNGAAISISLFRQIFRTSPSPASWTT